MLKNPENPVIALEKQQQKQYLRFMICGNCFWCATYLFNFPLDKCPVCAANRIEGIPLSDNEEYSLSNNPKTGLILNFALKKR
jgi:hypothetical protein